jgi:hypothetical protein
LQVTAACWEGIEAGHGHLQARRVTVARTGRGEAAQPRQAELWLPDAGGSIAAVEPVAPVVPVVPGERERSAGRVESDGVVEPGRRERRLRAVS